MFDRLLTEKIAQTMRNSPAVALLGPRQVGKTTLSHVFSETQALAENRDSLYLDLENPDDLLKLSDPSAFLSLHRDKLVILDEIQRAPNLFLVLRGLIDKNRRAGRKGEQYLLLGSASMELLRQSSESLAGRISYLELGGFNLLEVPADQPKDIHKLWLQGGFPESYLANDDISAMDWLENFIRTYLERDIPQMGFRVPAVRLRRLWTMLAHWQGEPINFSKLGANLGVHGKTVSGYVEILVDLLLVRRLNPWHANVKKRLVKSPRFYLRDTGILHRLLGIDQYDSLLSHPVLGKSWEGFVLENILSVLSSQAGGHRAEPYFYRTTAGAEIDLLLKLPNNDLWAIEIKNGGAPKIPKGFHIACDDVNATQKYVVYGGDDEFPVNHRTTILSLKRMLLKLANLL